MASWDHRKTILLSAYACQPFRGSEDSIGWNWAVELARLGHDVWVMTRKANEPEIARALEAEPIENLRFVYVDLPDWAIAWKRQDHAERTYYLIWQVAAYLRARTLIRQVKFDLVHHVTLGSFRYPHFLAFLGLPFTLGPIGGGEIAPLPLRKSYTLRGLLVEAVRDVSNLFIVLDPIAHAVFRRSERIYCTTRETYLRIPAQFSDKCQIAPNIGIRSNAHASLALTPERSRFRVLYVGRLLYWKGIHLALRAFAEACRSDPEATMTIIGSGPEERWLRDLAQRLGISSSVEWVPWMEHDDVQRCYRAHEVFLFPSLHDSGGMVVLEALARGLPVICLDRGGPGMLVDDSCGMVVPTDGKNEAAVVDALAEALKRMRDPQLRLTLQSGAYAQAERMSWKNVVTRVYSER